VVSTRRLKGLPPDGARVGVPPEKEADDITRFQTLYAKFQDGDPRSRAA
jgi:hypothetical protein